MRPGLSHYRYKETFLDYYNCKMRTNKRDKYCSWILITKRCLAAQPLFHDHPGWSDFTENPTACPSALALFNVPGCLLVPANNVVLTVSNNELSY